LSERSRGLIIERSRNDFFLLLNSVMSAGHQATKRTNEHKVHYAKSVCLLPSCSESYSVRCVSATG